VSALQRLKDLLLDDERVARARHAARIETLEQRKLSPAELTALIDRAGKGDTAPQLALALAEPVADALGEAVVSRRQTIVDALFPVIGPAIRKAMAEALRNMVADLNAAIESSFTPRGLAWRLEAWRTGAPYAQVVLRHTLRWRIEHLFLIEPDSGLVIHRESAPGLSDLDSDAIAGMLTAIGDFVQDSVGRTQGATLGSASVGEHLLWVDEGPRARLASFIRGAPPAALREMLRQRLEQIHARFSDPLAQLQGGAAGIDAALDQALDLPGVERDARALDNAPPPRSARWPLLVLALALLALLGAWQIDAWRWSQRLTEVAAALRDWPGMVVQEISRKGDAVTVRALLDPLADSPAQAIAIRLPADARVTLATRGYIATDAAIVERRARAVLGLPTRITLGFADGQLSIAGAMPAAQRDGILARAALVPGVLRVDADGLLATEVGLQAEFDVLLAAVESLRVPFDGDAETPADTQIAQRMVAGLRVLGERAFALDRRLILRTWGSTDGSGAPARNAQLRAARALWLAEHLAGALGVEVLAERSIEESARRATLDGRAAGVRVEQGAARQP